MKPGFEPSRMDLGTNALSKADYLLLYNLQVNNEGVRGTDLPTQLTNGVFAGSPVWG